MEALESGTYWGSAGRNKLRPLQSGRQDTWERIDAMIIFINGAFGVGKTTVAEMLVKAIPNSMLFDAENVGYFLRHLLQGIEWTEDFQDLAMWRPLVVTTARLLRKTYGRTLIMPMTIWYRPYFDEVIGGLREFEPQLYHFCLTARRDTIIQRLQRRDNSSQALAWCIERVERCAEAFQSPTFAQQIETDEKTPQEIVNEILKSILC